MRQLPRKSVYETGWKAGREAARSGKVSWLEWHTLPPFVTLEAQKAATTFIYECARRYGLHRDTMPLLTQLRRTFITGWEDGALYETQLQAPRRRQQVRATCEQAGISFT